jgi:hypothetical protein
LDNTPPAITLNKAVVGVSKNKPDFQFRTDLGGFTVTDNVSNKDDIEVTVSGLDMTTTGRQIVTYTATDQVGNSATAVQTVFVLPEGGMMIFGNETLISASLGESALFDTNRITFNITGFDLMKVNGIDRKNERALYDVYYQPGLYREGQMKSIATRMTYADLVGRQFTVVFPKAGWYTLIVRNQEREREYATFFIGSVE